MPQTNKSLQRALLLPGGSRKHDLFIANPYIILQEKLTDHRVSALLDYLSALKPTEVPHVTSLALSLNLSPSYLRFIFRAQTGMTLSRYIKHLRLHQAHRMLRETLLSVKQVMVLVGLDDHSHFARDYKRQFGKALPRPAFGLHKQKPSSRYLATKWSNRPQVIICPDSSITNSLDEN